MYNERIFLFLNNIYTKKTFHPENRINIDLKNSNRDKHETHKFFLRVNISKHFYFPHNLFTRSIILIKDIFIQTSFSLSL